MGKYKVPYRQMILAGLILTEILLIWLLTKRETPISAADWLTAYATETDEFRAMDFGDGVLELAYEKADEWDEEVYAILAAQLVHDAVSGQGMTEKSAKNIKSNVESSSEGSIDGNADNDSSGSANPENSSSGSGSSGNDSSENDSSENNSQNTSSELMSYKEYKQLSEILSEEKPVEWMKLVNGFKTILADIEYFPVALSEDGFSGLGYENGWGDARTYGGDRRHEGTDIMDNENIRGSYPIVSVSDGVVEHIGWLEQGGYRIGIRSPHGAYFYYAHLAYYAEDFAIGQTVSAGQIIGFMGDTGYSAVEGTVGNFPVHLHFGIYLETDHFDELSVNPYYILKYLENNTVSYSKETHLWYNVREHSEPSDGGSLLTVSRI